MRSSTAYRGYCWPVSSIDDLELAPFHLLASEGRVHVDRDHDWHMATLAQLSAAEPGLLTATPNQLVDARRRGQRAQRDRVVGAS